MEEAATPFPSEETTPPVTKIYFGAIHAARAWDFPVRRAYQPSQRMTYEQLSSECERVSNRRIDLGNLEIQKGELEKDMKIESMDKLQLFPAAWVCGKRGGLSFAWPLNTGDSCSIEQNDSPAETVCIDVIIKAEEHQRKPAAQTGATPS
ncbi:MAG: hypothetical protein WBH24_08430 [Candidatus Acidiferrum sp.]